MKHEGKYLRAAFDEEGEPAIHSDQHVSGRKPLPKALGCLDEGHRKRREQPGRKRGQRHECTDDHDHRITRNDPALTLVDDVEGL